MKRRTFLTNGMMLSAGMAFAGFPSLEAAENTTSGTELRTFQLTTTVEIIDPKGEARVWLPVPLSPDTEYFQHIENSWTGNYKDVQKIQQNTAGIVLAEWSPDIKAPKIEFISKFKTKNRQTDFSKPSKQKEDPKVLDHYLKASRLIKTDGIVAETSQKIIKGKQSDIDKARAIYEWIVENTYRDPKVRGCGVGDISSMLHTGNLGGKCADLECTLCRSGAICRPSCSRYLRHPLCEIL